MANNSKPATVQQSYEDWWISVRPPGVSVGQTDDMRRAFYSGGFAIFCLMVELTQRGSEENHLKSMLRIKDELTSFFEKLPK